MNIKKIGLTALAGSLVATTAFAGELSVTGAAKFSYKSMDGSNERVGATTGTTGTGMDTASKFAMDQEITASGSAELDNGMTVSVSHGLAATGGSGSDTSTLTLDMGDMGKLAYSDTDISGGLKALDDKMPAAYEEVTDGVNGEVQAAMGNGAGFSWSSTIGGASVGIAVSDNYGASTDRSDGSQDTTAAGSSSSSSIGITYPVADTGLTVFGGIGTEGQGDSTEIDHNTIGALYAYGPVTIGYQRNDEDNSAADNTVAADEDLETTIYGVSFMVNENLSISYGEHTTTSTATGAVDQELDGVQIAYSMGGMTISAYQNEGENISNVAGTSEATEILVSFAF
jgi:outer membrane protein OmpU